MASVDHLRRHGSEEQHKPWRVRERRWTTTVTVTREGNFTRREVEVVDGIEDGHSKSSKRNSGAELSAGAHGAVAEEEGADGDGDNLPTQSAPSRYHLRHYILQASFP